MAILLDNIKKYLEELNEESSAYFLFAILILSSAIASFINTEYAKAFFWLSIIFLCYGFFVFLFLRLKKIWGSAVGKLLVSGLVFVGSTFSLSLSKIAINTSFQVPASPFIHTQALLSALLAPLVLSILLGITSIIIIPIMMPFLLSRNETFTAKQILLFWKRDSFIPENGYVSCLRFVVLLAFILICFAFSSKNDWYTSKVTKFAKWYAYSFETEQFSYCKLEKNERIAYIG
ncbi:MAG: hypothetical protein D3907_00735, partial [Candidatus Electrothrix sp. AUS3]|nr:hypothetical protein [Candidatus Electrothrix gigas]